MKKPDFLIIGFPRCGTTSLVLNLNLHSDIFCLPEEGWLFGKGKEKEAFELLQENKLNGEKSPHYILDRTIMEKISMEYPDIKLIICLRHPIQAFHSFYNWRVREHILGRAIGINPNVVSFEKLVFEDLKIKGIWNSVYCYMKYIQENVLQFFDRKQIYFVIQERMFEDVNNEVKKIFEFLGVNNINCEFFRDYNYTEKQTYPPIDYSSENYPKVIEKLYNLYKPFNDSLYKFLGEKIPEWEEFDRNYEKIILKKEPENITILGHRCSGSSYLARLLELNFNVKCSLDYSDSINLLKDKNEKIIYIARDGRDVLISNYYFWKQTKESESMGIKEYFSDLSFSDYLRGRIRLENYTPKKGPWLGQRDINAGIFSEPIHRWVIHVENCYNKVFFVMYEDLISNPKEFLKIIQDKFNLKPLKKTFAEVRSLVEIYPKKREFGNELFSEEDEKLFWEKAGETMKKLGYKKEREKNKRDVVLKLIKNYS